MNARMVGVALVLCGALWACWGGKDLVPKQQPAPLSSDAFAQCEDGGPGAWGCPGEPRARCRYEVLRKQHSPCAKDYECELVRPDDNCMGVGDCEPSAVASQYSAAFETAASAELAQACSGSTCRSSGSCASVGFTAVCDQGRCALRITQPDGGPLVGDPSCDAGQAPRPDAGP